MTPSRAPARDPMPDYGPRRLTVELTNACNLHCPYCLRDDDALHHAPASFLPVDLFARIAREARDAMGIEHVTFTGGEPTLHRQFDDVLAAVAELSLTCSVVTNGWHFERVWPRLAEYRRAVTHVAFSLDGPTREVHDRWRGRGSFDRVVRAFSRCWAARFPFQVKVGLRRDTVSELERFAMFAARLGAAGLSFAHVMPTSAAVADTSALTLAERAAAERDIAHLARILRMPIAIDVGYYNTGRGAPCSPLAGVTANINYRGQLSLCCSLSGFRGALGDLDIAGDLTREPFAVALERLRRLSAAQSAHRERALAACEAAGAPPDLTTGSPCLFCLQTLGKTPWSPGSRLDWPGVNMSKSHDDSPSPLSPSDHVVFTDLGGAEGVLVDLDARQYYQLNETASLIWRGLTNGTPVAAIAREMTARYDVTLEQAQSSAEAAIGELIAHRLLKTTR